MTNRSDCALHVGVTSDNARRTSKHLTGTGSMLARRQGSARLVYTERHEDILPAIQSEKNIKDWPKPHGTRPIVAGYPIALI